MRRAAAFCFLLLSTAPVGAVEELFDRIDEALTWSTADARGRARVSGALDLEYYLLDEPAPGLIETEAGTLFTPRLTVFLDTQWGESLYGFVQARADRGFDPSDEGLEARFDEYALRWRALPDSRLDLQVGRFATVVGNWSTRHDSWANPFITAPLPYENLTGIWDNEPVRSVGQLLAWAHVRGGGSSEGEKYLRLPIIWGPSYATGAAIAGAAGRFRYAAEIKNASLASRPQAWSVSESRWSHPTFSGRVRYVPDERWEFGWSASTGSYLRPVADSLLPAGISRNRHRQTVLAQDASFAWRHLQLWAEIYAARFELPRIGNADTLAYYIEGRYKLGPRLFLSARWNQQFFGKLQEEGRRVRWGHEVQRLDLASTHRVSAHAQLKLQYTVQNGDQDTPHTTHFFAAQATVRF